MSRTALDPRLPWRMPPIDPRASLLHARHSAHWLSREIFRKKPYGWIVAGPLISHNPRESKKQALWPFESTVCRTIRAKWSSKGSSSLNVMPRQGTSRCVRDPARYCLCAHLKSFSRIVDGLARRRTPYRTELVGKCQEQISNTVG